MHALRINEEDRVTHDIARDGTSDVHDLAERLLDQSDDGADHTELRRTARGMWPELALDPKKLGAIVGHAATLRAERRPRATRDVTDARLDRTPREPLSYAPKYTDLDDDARATVIRFCEDRISRGMEGPEVLSDLLGTHGWPYSERTFYVGPWKAARLRLRRRAETGDGA